MNDELRKTVDACCAADGLPTSTTARHGGTLGARWALAETERALVARVAALRDTAALYTARGAESTYGDVARADSLHRQADALLGLLGDVLTIREGL